MTPAPAGRRAGSLQTRDAEDVVARAVVRLRDIADKTGFSTNTVSLALRESTRIPLETRSIIQSAALELGYLPNQIAKSLVSRETRTIGLVLTDILNPTLTHTAQAVEMALAERGYGTLFATSNNTLVGRDEGRRDVPVAAGRRHPDLSGPPPRARSLAPRCGGSNYPIVLLIADPDAGIDGVSINDRSGFFQATRHLIGLGHRRIGFLDATRAAGNYREVRRLSAGAGRQRHSLRSRPRRRHQRPLLRGTVSSRSTR